METAATVLDLIASLPSSTRGTLLFGDDASSSVGVFVSDGEVCWASATRDRRTLACYLRWHARLPLTDGQIGRIYRRCERDGEYFGEALVRRGLVTPGGLAAALLSQAMHAFAVIDEGIGSPYFIPSDKPAPTHRISLAAPRLGCYRFMTRAPGLTSAA